MRVILHNCLSEKTEKHIKHKTVKGIYCTSHHPVMTLFCCLVTRAIFLPSPPAVPTALTRAENAPRKRKKADPRLSGIGFASSDKEKSIARGTRGVSSGRSATKYSIVRNTDNTRFPHRFMTTFRAYHSIKRKTCLHQFASHTQLSSLINFKILIRLHVFSEVGWSNYLEMRS